MKIIFPADFTLVSTNVAASALPEYASGTTYASGEQVKVTGENREYESLQVANQGHTPVDSPEWWLDLGATNQRRMFDEFLNTRTENAESIVVTLGVSQVDHVIMLGVTGHTATIELLTADGSTVVWSEIVNLVVRDPVISSIKSWHDWFFHPQCIMKTDLYREVRASLITARLRVTVSYPGGTAACSALLVGGGQSAGGTIYPYKPGGLNYGKTNTDEYGRTSYVPGATARTLDCSVEIAGDEDATAVARLLAAADNFGGPVAFLGDNGLDIEALMLYGRLREHSIQVDRYNKGTARLYIVGVV